MCHFHCCYRSGCSPSSEIGRRWKIYSRLLNRIGWYHIPTSTILHPFHISSQQNMFCFITMFAFIQQKLPRHTQNMGEWKKFPPPWRCYRRICVRTFCVEWANVDWTTQRIFCQFACSLTPFEWMSVMNYLFIYSQVTSTPHNRYVLYMHSTNLNARL